VRNLIDFYRGNLVMTAAVLVAAIALAVATLVFSTGGIILPVAFALLVGLLVGIVVAAVQRRS